MMNLGFEDRRYLLAAEGWLELGSPLEANDELDNITAELRAHPHVLEVRYKVYERLERWDMALEITRAMTTMLPNNPWGVFHQAFCLHELKRTDEAYQLLLPVLDQYPNEWLMRFNLACYACQMGRLSEALSWLEKAIDMAGKKDIRLMALEDPDLEPLWTQISEI